MLPACTPYAKIRVTDRGNGFGLQRIPCEGIDRMIWVVFFEVDRSISVVGESSTCMNECLRLDERA